LRAVGAAIVSNQNFATHAKTLEAELGFFDAACQRFRLIEAAHEDGELNGPAYFQLG
jgi:hypothetical protein